ncbi:hypothetical protein BKA65DRAFT_550936 [Rhexocercosporidium sp. MPI-PUGE-AT-0058]|nr:hypothetical protein BKA65DRAFT_550936 [Rhexocercosporidium sp. MPI-PUGE-AT-0058]
MAHIYEGALLVIAASWAKTIHNGFLQNFPPHGYEDPEQVFQLRYLNDLGTISDTVLAPAHQEGIDYLSERGWAFQERLCAKRILKYASTCVSWACHSALVCDRKCYECAKWGESLAGAWKDERDSWKKMVMEYSARKLSVAQDRLRTIAGIAERRHQLLIREGGDVYLAGLWKSSLLTEMLWYVRGDQEFIRQPLTYLAPSWSWASDLQHISYLGSWSYHVPRVEIIEAAVEYASSLGTYGLVTSGYVTLRGSIIRGHWN